jgi:tyrosyl-tRNA synthetase
MYQFLFNQPDTIVEKLLKRLTYVSLEKIAETMNIHKEAPFKRIAQKLLACEVVKDIHGQEELDKALKITDAFFSGKLEALSPSELIIGLGNKNSVETTEKTLDILDALMLINAVSSKTEGRKIIEQKGISVNGVVVEDISTKITSSDAINGSLSYIKKGKKDYFAIY